MFSFAFWSLAAGFFSDFLESFWPPWGGLGVPDGGEKGDEIDVFS